MKKSQVTSHKSQVNLKGFTLVELLIAMSILSISILAAFTAVSNNIKGANFSEDQIVGYYLADEGIEYIRNIRDQNGIKNIQMISSGGSYPWLSGIADVASDPCYNKVCVIDSPANVITSCSGSASTCPYVRVDPSSGLYGYNALWNVTQFQRSITVTVNSSTEATVSCTVSWVTNGVAKNYTVSEIIRAWQ